MLALSCGQAKTDEFSAACVWECYKRQTFLKSILFVHIEQNHAAPIFAFKPITRFL